MDLAYIPSPSQGVIHLGPIPLRGYAFCIIIGVFVAVWLGSRRWVARGGQKTTVADIAVWAVPFGLVGGRLYHVITDYELYFDKGRDWVGVFKIWDGGLGIWGAIALGALGAWIGCRRHGVPLPAYADAVAPGVAFAQATGRWGNWFNQELYGGPTKLPWALRIDADPSTGRAGGLYHPTFLYESLWCIGVALLVIWADRRFRLGHGRAFAVYVAAYTVGRFWIEHMRTDFAHHILGMRLNDWTAIIVFAGAVAGFVLSARLRPGREETVEPRTAAAGDGPDDDPAAGAAAEEPPAAGGGAAAPPGAPAADAAHPADAAAPDAPEAGAPETDAAAPGTPEPADAEAQETPEPAAPSMQKQQKQQKKKPAPAEQAAAPAGDAADAGAAQAT